MSKAQALVVNREHYLTMVRHRKEVCPVFRNVDVEEAAAEIVPENSVPDVLLKSATHMPEISNVKTTMHGPASRIPLFSRDTAFDEKESLFCC